MGVKVSGWVVLLFPSSYLFYSPSLSRHTFWGRRCEAKPSFHPPLSCRGRLRAVRLVRGGPRRSLGVVARVLRAFLLPVVPVVPFPDGFRYIHPPLAVPA